ncbi:MAG: PEGA domain-containing protein, partial [Gemmatimonadota bacterium]
FGSVIVNANPPGHVYVDGEYLGPTPLAGYPLNAGRHRIRIQPIAGEASDYGPLSTQFELGPFEWNKRLGPFSLPPK